jgi:hypothetical protein
MTQARPERQPCRHEHLTKACDEDRYRILSQISPVGSAKLKVFQGEPTALWPIVLGMAVGS